MPMRLSGVSLVLVSIPGSKEKRDSKRLQGKRLQGKRDVWARAGQPVRLSTKLPVHHRVVPVFHQARHLTSGSPLTAAAAAQQDRALAPVNAYSRGKGINLRLMDLPFRCFERCDLGLKDCSLFLQFPYICP